MSNNTATWITAVALLSAAVGLLSVIVHTAKFFARIAREDRRLRVLAVVTGFFFFSLTVINWLILGGISALIGGSAVRGKVESGQFFLRASSKYTAVSSSTYTSLWYYETITRVWSAFVIGFVLVAAFLIYEFERSGKNESN